ncbi:MAG: Flp pilus assembly complex ATPase component TadA [Desulfobulbaceae bacterium]|nr:Flp pilus assembly complex ATPase component TadA [Desulfobulbaceae bacterium]
MDEHLSSPENISERLSYELRFKKLANAIHTATSPNEIMVGLRSQILDVYNVEMATIFLIDAARMELVSWVMLPGDFLRKIRVPVDKTSISGYAAATRDVVLINDAYDRASLRLIDPELRFDSSWDRKTGSRTRQVLAAPIMFKRSLQGVIQLMNRRNGDFSEDDKQFIADLAETLGIAFHNLQQLSQKIPTRYDMLVKSDLISDKELDRAFAIANQHDSEVEDILIHNFRIPKEDLGNALAAFYNTGYVDLTTVKINVDELFEGINIDYLRKIRQVPLSFENGKLVLAAEDPNDHSNILEMQQVFRAENIDVQLTLPSDIDEFLNRLKPAPAGHEELLPEHSFAELIEQIESDELQQDQRKIKRRDVDQRPIVKLVSKIIEDAYRLNASDIHVEPYGQVRDAEVRYRVDGQCLNVLTVPKKHIRSVIARFKILADLDIAERRRPQDGKIKYRTSTGNDIELRIATIPTADGNEDVVLRVLADSKPLPLQDIMPGRIVEKFKTIITRPYGIVLVVGPTGSGKTTTLHSALNFINTPEKKIWTAEDPVEITQYRLRQVQIRSKIGLTFAAAMRAFLRADPDVIMVGEMRDQETAQMGIQASLTGHLVFSTLHTNSASETITRLIDMGMDPFNFADALLGILAQRLVKTLCPACRQQYHPDKNEYDHLKQLYGQLFDQHVNIAYSRQLSLYKPKGCDRCNNTGYKGRAGLYELLVKDEALNKLIIERASVDNIRQAATASGMTTLMQEGIQMVFAGRTDFNQVMQVCSL